MSGATTEVGAPLRDCWSLTGLVLTPRDATSYPVVVVRLGLSLPDDGIDGTKEFVAVVIREVAG